LRGAVLNVDVNGSLWPITEKDNTILHRAFDDVASWVLGDIVTQYERNDAYLDRLSLRLFDKVRKEVEHIEALRATSTSNQETPQ
jgi:hypothetical protein